MVQGTGRYTRCGDLKAGSPTRRYCTSGRSVCLRLLPDFGKNEGPSVPLYRGSSFRTHEQVYAALTAPQYEATQTILPAYNVLPYRPIFREHGGSASGISHFILNGPWTLNPNSVVVHSAPENWGSLKCSRLARVGDSARWIVVRGLGRH